VDMFRIAARDSEILYLILFSFGHRWACWGLLLPYGENYITYSSISSPGQTSPAVEGSLFEYPPFGLTLVRMSQSRFCLNAQTPPTERVAQNVSTLPAPIYSAEGGHDRQ
jgi:hypothetical protein